MTSKRQAELEGACLRLVADLRTRPLEPYELSFVLGHIAVENERAIASERWTLTETARSSA